MKTSLYIALAALTLTVTPALATPGAVNGSGCHGRNGRMGYHCHHGELSHFSNGRSFVAGHFSRERSSRRVRRQA